MLVFVSGFLPVSNVGKGYKCAKNLLYKEKNYTAEHRGHTFFC